MKKVYFWFFLITLSSCKPVTVLKNSKGESSKISYEKVRDADEIVFHSSDIKGNGFVFLDLKDKDSTGFEQSYGFSFFLQGLVDNSSKIIIAKFDQKSDKSFKKASSVVSFYIHNGKIYGEIRYSLKTKGDKELKKFVFGKKRITKSGWQDVSFKINWNHKESEIEAFLNNEKLGKYKGPIGVKALKSGKMKIGIMQKTGDVYDYKVRFKNLIY